MARKQENLLESYENYLRMIESKSEKTIKNYLSSMRVFFRFTHEDFDNEKITLTQVKRIEPKSINEYKMFLTKENYSGSTMRARLDALLSFYTFLAEEYDLEVVKHIKQLSKIKKGIKTNPKKKEVLTEEEAYKLLQTVKNDYDSRFRERDFLAFSLFLANGLRLSELLNLKEEDIDLEEKKIYFSGETTKGNKRAYLELRDDVIQVYNEYLDWKRDSKHSDNNYIFVSNISDSERLSDKQMEYIVNQYKTKAGIEKNITPHCLRATLATLLDKNGASAYEIKEQLRHSNIQTTGIYININGSRMREVSNMNPLSF